MTLAPGPGARDTDPATSHAAAARSPSTRDIDRIRVLLVHDSHPRGLTDFELGAMVGRQQTSAGKRRGELRDMGYIADGGERRPAPSGSSAIVWRITVLGIFRAAQLRQPGALRYLPRFQAAEPVS
jgi:hypothetical protein